MLDAHPEADLHVIAIWMPALGGESRGTIDERLFDDPRATVFWDPEQVAGKWFAERGFGGVKAGGFVYDVYYAFGGDARWEDEPTGLLASGAPIIGETDALVDRFFPLLD